MDEEKIKELMNRLKESSKAIDIVFNRGEYRYGSPISTYEEFNKIANDCFNYPNYMNEIIKEYFSFYFDCVYGSKRILERCRLERENFIACICANEYNNLKSNIKNTSITLDDICSSAMKGLASALTNYDFKRSIDMDSFKAYVSNYIKGEIINYIKDISELDESDINAITKMNKEIEGIKKITTKEEIRDIDILLYEELKSFFDNKNAISDFELFVNSNGNLNEAISILKKYIVKEIDVEKITKRLEKIEILLYIKMFNTTIINDFEDTKNPNNMDYKEDQCILDEKNRSLICEILNNPFYNNENIKIKSESLTNEEKVYLFSVLNNSRIDDFMNDHNITSDEYNKKIYKVLLKLKEE